MKFVRYIAANDTTIDGGRRVCQLQYDEEFIQEVVEYSKALQNLSFFERNRDNSITLNIYGQQGIEVKFGDILNDDRAQGEFYEVEEDETYDGLPDETLFSNDDDIDFNNLVVASSYIILIGYTKNGDEVSSEILIEDLKPFV